MKIENSKEQTISVKELQDERSFPWVNWGNLRMDLRCEIIQSSLSVRGQHCVTESGVKTRCIFDPKIFGEPRISKIKHEEN